MYSWGDDTVAWKNPGEYDFGSARRAYLDRMKKDADAKGPRTYAARSAPKLELVDPKGKTISTDSENPVVVAVDGTGSMQTWPAEIFDRLPLLYQTLSKYKPDAEISFSVIGDAFADNWPVQVGGFGKGPALDDILKALKAEGGGGGGARESYELWAYFMQECSRTPRATSPFMIIMGDEGFYEKIGPDEAKHFLGITPQEPVDAVDVWKALAQRYDIFLLHKEYKGKDTEIVSQWAEAIGQQKIIPVHDPARVVDVAMGLVARRWGQFGDFEKSLGARQDRDGIATVMTSLRAAPGVDKGLNSRLKGAKTGKKSIGLA